MTRSSLIVLSGLLATSFSAAVDLSNEIGDGSGAVLGDNHLMAMMEEDIPLVGLGAMHGICDSSSTIGCGSKDQEVKNELNAALEDDAELTAAGDIEMGELLCDSLDAASDSDFLRFAISSDKTVTARKISYWEFDGDAFTDKAARKVWRGEVIEPVTSGPPRAIRMAWETPCNAEGFALRITKLNPDGTKSITTNAPCDIGSSTDLCMIQYTEPAMAINPVSREVPRTSGGDRHLTGSNPSIEERAHGLDEDASTMSNTRKLSAGFGSTTEISRIYTIDVMVVYTPNALTRVPGGVKPAAMEALIADEMLVASAATRNSKINLGFRLVHTEKIFGQTSTNIIEQSDRVEASADIATLRDYYKADLVVLVGAFPDQDCSLSWHLPDTEPANEKYGFSAVDPRCFGGTWLFPFVIGNALGCSSNRANTDFVSTYGYGFQRCSGKHPFVTVMAAECDEDGPSLTISYFSNPAVSYGGRTTGTSTANNARTVKDNMAVVSNFRNKNTANGVGPTMVTKIQGTALWSTPRQANGMAVRVSEKRSFADQYRSMRLRTDGAGNAQYKFQFPKHNPVQGTYRIMITAFNHNNNATLNKWRVEMYDFRRSRWVLAGNLNGLGPAAEGWSTIMLKLNTNRPQDYTQSNKHQIRVRTAGVAGSEVVYLDEMRIFMN